VKIDFLYLRRTIDIKMYVTIYDSKKTGQSIRGGDRKIGNVRIRGESV
jgi:hypothetical protein